MQVLVDAREKLDIAWEHPMTEHAANQAILFHSSNDLDVETFRQYAPFINRLWQDKAIKKAYDRRREFQLVRIIASYLPICYLLFFLFMQTNHTHILTDRISLYLLSFFILFFLSFTQFIYQSTWCWFYIQLHLSFSLISLFRATLLVTFLTNSIEYHGLITFHQTKIFFIVVRRQKVSLSLQLEYK